MLQFLPHSEDPSMHDGTGIGFSPDLDTECGFHLGRLAMVSVTRGGVPTTSPLTEKRA